MNPEQLHREINSNPTSNPVASRSVVPCTAAPLKKTGKLKNQWQKKGHGPPRRNLIRIHIASNSGAVRPHLIREKPSPPPPNSTTTSILTHPESNLLETSTGGDWLDLDSSREPIPPSSFFPLFLPLCAIMGRTILVFTGILLLTLLVLSSPVRGQDRRCNVPGGRPTPIRFTPDCPPGFYCPNIVEGNFSTFAQVCPPGPQCQLDRLAGKFCQGSQISYLFSFIQMASWIIFCFPCVVWGKKEEDSAGEVR